ncbi:hypothetical protein [Falsibacillus pallidus]|uniref:hypothetical protein n=1 Tax=Falsibacillus pallidus TaxID=493781 RepID=UPI003D967876
MLHIEEILQELSKKRPIFRSEEDFNQSLNGLLKSHYGNCTSKAKVNGIKVDLMIENGDEEILIQLKHKTRKISVMVDGVSFDLKNHGAQDQFRYDYLKDVKSLEPLCLDNPVRKGYAILLTNDHLYWQKPNKVDSVDKDFHLNEGRSISGTLVWSSTAGNGTTSSREEPIELKGHYKMSWYNYSAFRSQDSEFRCLVVEV